jgi:hypothetical protein
MTLKSGASGFTRRVYTHRQNLDWSKRYFLRCVGLQVSYAHRMAEKASRLFAGSEPDISSHPDNGLRQERDELVGLIDNFYIPMGKKEPPLQSGAFRFVKEHLPAHLLFTAGADRLTVEFPFSGDEPVIVRLAMGKRGVVTSLLRMNSTEGHPMLGKGLMMRMMLPVSYLPVMAIAPSFDSSSRTGAIWGGIPTTPS